MKKQTNLLRASSMLFLCLIIALPAQMTAKRKKKKKPEGNRDDSWDYTIVRNAPAQTSPYTISLYPLMFGANGLAGTGLGVEAAINYQVNDDFEAFGRIDYNYLVIGMGSDEYAYRPATFGANLGFEVDGTWFFSNETRHGTEGVVLYSESGGYRTTIVHVAKIKLDHQQKFGLRLGFNLLNYTVGDGDGMPYVLYNTNDPAMTKFSPGTSMVANAHSGILAIGLASEKIHDYKLTFKNGVERNISRKIAWHLDLLLNTFTNFDNVVSQDSVYNLTKYTPRSAIGARIGFSSQNLLPFGGNFGFDIGLMPARQINYSFVSLNTGWLLIREKVNRKTVR